MPLPDVILDIKDGQLGILPENTDDVHLKLGVSSGGVPLTMYSFTDTKDAISTLLAGPLLERTVSSLAEGAPVVYAMSLTPSAVATVTAVVLVGTGTAVLGTTGSAPKDAYEVIVKITRAGTNLAALSAAFQISLDGGDTFGFETAIPLGGVISSAVPNTGLVLTFTDGTFVVGDTYSFNTTAPAMQLTDIIAALDAALADPREWRFVHIVGASSSTIATGVAVKMQTARTAHRYTRAILEARDRTAIETDAAYQSALNTDFALFADARVAVIAAPAEVVSPITGRINRSSAAGVITGRIARRRISEDAGRVATGPLAGITKLWHNESANPGLDSQRFITLRTHVGRQGFYVTQGKSMAALGSDYTFLQNGFVMDKACKIARDELMKYLNESLRVDATTGFILEVEAQAIEADLRGVLNAGLLAPGDISAEPIVRIKRNNNILSSGQLFCQVGIIPLAYGKYIFADLGFINPALVPQIVVAAAGQKAA